MAKQTSSKPARAKSNPKLPAGKKKQRLGTYPSDEGKSPYAPNDTYRSYHRAEAAPEPMDNQPKDSASRKAVEAKASKSKIPGQPGPRKPGAAEAEVAHARAKAMGVA